MGCTTDFKTRWRHHNKSFNNANYKHETVLSSHIWDCKNRGSEYKVSWKILDRGQPFNPVTNTCKLCVREQFYILRKPHLASLNHRQEIGTHCPHIRMSLLRNVEKVKVPAWKWKFQLEDNLNKIFFVSVSVSICFSWRLEQSMKHACRDNKDW